MVIAHRSDPVTDPLKLSKQDARERRSAFSAKAQAMAEAAGLPARQYKKGGFPLPSWARFYHDGSALAVLVCGGESWRTVEKALAYALAHAGGRRLGVVLPGAWQEKNRSVLRAMRRRAPSLRPDPRLCTPDGNKVRSCPPMDP